MPIYFEVYQHGVIINSCNGYTCATRLLIGDETDVVIKMSAQSDRLTWATSQHNVLFGKFVKNESICLPPQVNVFSNLQTGCFNSNNSEYEYSFPFVNLFYVDISFNDSVELFVTYNNKIIYNETVSSILKTFYLQNDNVINNYISVVVWTNSSFDIFVEKFNIYPLGMIQYDQYIENQLFHTQPTVNPTTYTTSLLTTETMVPSTSTTQTNSNLEQKIFDISLLTMGICAIILILVIIIMITKCKKLCNKRRINIENDVDLAVYT